MGYLHCIWFLCLFAIDFPDLGVLAGRGSISKKEESDDTPPMIGGREGIQPLLKPSHNM